jgi:alpha-amylase/alpha-mannosidase (GH57 family)
MKTIGLGRLLRQSALLILLVALLPLHGVLAEVPPIDGSAAQQPAAEPLYVALIWHQHQPVYFKDPATGLYSRPWVRVHATKDYLDMATILENYPDVHVTFNYTPSLIRQLDDIGSGAKDTYWTLAEVPAEELTADQKQFILERFFDTNRRIIARFPRYQELLEARDGMGIPAAVESWSAQDFRDLQILFNLAWTDPDWLAEEPLASLVAKGAGFSEEDKPILFAEHLRIVQEVIPYHAQMQQTGQIEVTMTPYAHPILPLLVDSDIASVAMPDAELPTRFVFGQDAVGQVERGIQLYEARFGMSPRGMWPAEGSVSQQIIQMVANAGIQWIATDEEVLARSLPDIDDFTRDSSDTVRQADALYQPYEVTGGRGGRVAILFRDKLISDRIGFEYSGTPGEAAAADLMDRLNNIQAELAAEGAEGPHLVTILLDGENAWEHYANDGKDFLHAMYRNLGEADNIQTVTPSEYLAMVDGLTPIENLWPGSWITPDFSTWIGEEEENLAWQYLLETRLALQQAEVRLSAEVKDQALEAMYNAEGSDWFWYLGADQDSGQDWTFEQQFRGHLRRVYELISVPVPGFLDVPIIPTAVQIPDQVFTMPSPITVDGVAADEEWSPAAYYDLAGSGILNGLYYSPDGQTLYLRLDVDPTFEALADTTFGLYFSSPASGPLQARPRDRDDSLLGFGARRLVEVTVDAAGGAVAAAFATTDSGSGWAATEIAFPAEGAAYADGVLEIGIPLADFIGDLRPGNSVNMRLVVETPDGAAALFPADGLAVATMPDAAIPNVVLEVADPEGDDYGPGSYLYPRDVVFRRGAYDLTDFIVGSDDQDVIFRVNFRGPVENDWGAPNGMGIITADIYIDVDGPDNGDRLLLPGRNAALTADHAWDYAIWAEGWTPGVYRPGEEGPVQVDGQINILTNAGQQRITIRVPRSMLPGDPADWSYAVTVASQEGYPSAGVWRIRDVQPTAEQWRVGGSLDDTNHTRLIDVLYPESGQQEALLSGYESSSEDVGLLGPDDFGQVPMVNATTAE